MILFWLILIIVWFFGGSVLLLHHYPDIINALHDLEEDGKDMDLEELRDLISLLCIYMGPIIMLVFLYGIVKGFLK